MLDFLKLVTSASHKFGHVECWISNICCSQAQWKKSKQIFKIRQGQIDDMPMIEWVGGNIFVGFNQMLALFSKYRISSYSFRGNYSFLNLEIIRPKVTVHKCAETIWGNTVLHFTEVEEVLLIDLKNYHFYLKMP